MCIICRLIVKTGEQRRTLRVITISNSLVIKPNFTPLHTLINSLYFKLFNVQDTKNNILKGISLKIETGRYSVIVVWLIPDNRLCFLVNLSLSYILLVALFSSDLY